MLVMTYRVLGSPETFEIAEAPGYAELMDFSVGSEYVYVVYRRRPPDYQESDYRENRDVVLGIYALSSGTEVSRVDLASLWEEFSFSSAPLRPGVKTVSRSGGVVVQADRPGGETFLAHVNPGGDVTVRRHYEGVMAVSLGRYRDFTMVHTNKSVMLLDDQFEVQYEWSAPEPLLLIAEPNGNDILVLDGEMAEDPKGMHRLSVTFRWLTLEDRLIEKASIALSATTFYYPPPRLLVWPSQLSLFAHDGS